MNTSAGCALYHRKPIDAPTIAPQKTVNSRTSGQALQFQIGSECRMAADVGQHGHSAGGDHSQPMARPSNPSVRFTASDEPTITSTTKAINGKNAKGHK